MCIGDQPDAPYSASPTPPVDTGAGAVSGGGPPVGVVKGRHSRGRSMTNKAEMMSRPSSAKAKIDVVSSHDVGGGFPRPMSPPSAPPIRETEVS